MSESYYDKRKQELIHEPIRDYEVSVWTLQDSYIATLKWSHASHKGQIQDPQMSISDDGTEEFSFEIPMYLQVQDGDVMRKIENPIWYMTLQKNEILIKNMRKIKVIFNKTMGTEEEKVEAHERVFEFLITKVEDIHEQDNPTCSVSCEGLAFHELGKQGYKLELSSDVYNQRWYDVANTEIGYWYDHDYVRHTEEPEATLDYWMSEAGVKKLPAQKKDRKATEWYYTVQMNYESYSMVNTTNRRTDVIYEEEYTRSWNDDLTTKDIQEVREKQRMVDTSESNIYNITQTIAETFEVFCKYVYSYDENYHIIGRTIVFYNNFVKDNSGERFEDITYPYDTDSISRELDSTDISTKMFVRPIEDDSAATGQISIIDTSANPTGEDYLMNFEYLHDIETISDEQYNEIKPFMEKMREFNYGTETEVENAKQRGQHLIFNQRFVTQINENDKEEIVYELDITDDGAMSDREIGTIAIKDSLECIYTADGWIQHDYEESTQGIITLQEQLIAAQSKKIDIDAKKSVAEKSQTYAEERMNDAAKHVGASDEVFTRDDNNPAQFVALDDPDRPSDPTNLKYYYKIAFNSANDSGILFNTVKLYKQYETAQTVFNLMLPTNLPKKSELQKYVDQGEEGKTTWDKAPSAVKQAVKDYVKYYKEYHPNDNTMTEAAVHTKFNGWIEKFNGAAEAKPGMPPTITKPISKYVSGSGTTSSTTNAYPRPGQTSYEDNELSNYDIFNDSIAWIAYMQGAAKINKFKITKKKKTKFEEYMLTSISINGTSYKLEANKGNHITVASWNDLVMARRAWCAHYQEGIGVNAVSLIGHTEVQIKPKWMTKNYAYLTAADPKYTLVVDKDHITEGSGSVPSNSNYLWISVNNQGQVIWHLQGHTQYGINALWTQYKQEVPFNSYDCFEEFIGKNNGANWGKNNIGKFTPVYDSNYNLSGIKNIFSNTPLTTIYATYSYQPSTYYKDIKEMWTRKYKAAVTDANDYGLQSEFLQTVIDQLEEQIRVRIKHKQDTIKEFDQIMGPALRESYWQPDDYQDYGDLYKHTVNTNATINNNMGYITFTNDMEVPATSKDDIKASFYWDTELFTDEQKSYYEYSVGQEKVNYPCIDLSAFFAGAHAQKLINFLNGDMSKLCFSFYNDSFDKKEYVKITENGVTTYQWKYTDKLYKYADTQDAAGKWYYNHTVELDSTNTESYTDIVEVERSEADKMYYMNTASMQLAFLKETEGNNSRIIPVLLMIGLDELPDSTLYFITQQVSDAIPTGEVSSGEGFHPGAQPTLGFKDGDNFTPVGTVQPTHWISWKIRHGTGTANQVISHTAKTYEMAYPRIQINSLQLKTQELILTCDDIKLSNYIQYYLLTRDNNYLLTLKPEVLFTNFNEKNIILAGLQNNYTTNNSPQFNIAFTVSNGGTYVYQDAIKVLKENSVPKVSYDVKPSILRHAFIDKLYEKLGQIVIINDTELKFENVFGYISSISLDLDHYWEDSIEVKNYKNKFEDLFSSIAAETEEMKKTGGVVSALCSGVLPASVVQAVGDTVNNTLTTGLSDTTAISNIVQAYLDANFDGPEVIQEELNNIINEVNEVIGAGAEGLAELAELTDSNASILGSFVQNIAALTQPTLKHISNIETATNYKPGDIFVAADGKTYIASSYDSIMPFYDGSTSKIVGANINIDAEAGVIDIEGGNEINIKSGEAVTIAADSTVNIIGNKQVNIGGCTINIGSGCISTVNDPNDLSDVPISEQGETYGDNADYGINIVSSFIDPSDPDSAANATSGVFIKPYSIEMLSSDIIMQGSQKILMYTSDGTTAGTSAIQIDKDQGIWIGSGKGIDIYSSALSSFDYDAETGELKQSNNNFAVITPAETDPNTGEIITEAVYDRTVDLATSVSIHSDRILMGVLGTSNATAVKITDTMMAIGSTDNILTLGDTTLPTYANNITGAIFQSDKIAFATGSGNTRNLISMSSEGLIIGAANTNLSEETGSYVKISTSGIYIGSLANLTVNTNNLKLQTKASATDGTDTYFAIGTNLQGISASTTPSSIAANSNISVGLFVGKNGTYVKGTIYADSGSFSGTVNATSGLIGDWTISNGQIYSIHSVASVLGTITTVVQLSNSNSEWPYLLYSQGDPLNYVDVSSYHVFEINNESRGLFGVTADGKLHALQITTGLISCGNINAYSVSAERMTLGSFSGNPYSNIALDTGGLLPGSEPSIVLHRYDTTNQKNIDTTTTITSNSLSTNSITTYTINSPIVNNAFTSIILNGTLNVSGTLNVTNDITTSKTINTTGGLKVSRENTEGSTITAITIDSNSSNPSITFYASKNKYTIAATKTAIGTGE